MGGRASVDSYSAGGEMVGKL